jgi:hypothetical protein
MVVTGASSGIGREIALEAARAGGTIVLVARSEAALREVAGQVSALGARARFLAIDLTAPDAGATLEAFLGATNLHCDVLVANAGLGLVGKAAELPREAQLGLVDLNIASPTDLALRFLPGMIARGRGGILFIGSIAGIGPGPGMALYYASKAYLRSLSEALWRETRGTGVAVTCLAPGPVATPFLDKSGAAGTRLFKILPKTPIEAVARAGLDGLARGKRLVVPGWPAKLVMTLAPFVPRGVSLWALSRLQRRKG